MADDLTGFAAEVGADVAGLLETAPRLVATASEEFRGVLADDAGQVALGLRADGTVSLTLAKDPFDVLLVAGQSNAQGAGKPVIADSQDPRLWQYPAASKAQTGIIPAVDPMQHQGPMTSSVGTGPGIPAARAWADAHPGRRVLIVPAAASQTGFSTSAPTYTGTWDWTAADDGTNLAINAVRQTKAALTAAGAGARLVGILWHQGEGDQAIATEYAAKLDGLIAWLRAQLSAPEVPFVVGQLGYERRLLNSNAQTIDRAHMGAQARGTRVSFARSVPAVHNPGDITHLSTRGQVLMGRAMAEALDRARYLVPGTAPIGPEKVLARVVGGKTVVTWTDAWAHVTSYRVEWSTDGTTWSTTGVSMYDPMDTTATIPQTGVQTRVTAVNATGDAEPVYS